MARYRPALDTPREREYVFAYRSDVFTAQEWDAGAVEAERLARALTSEPPAAAAA